MTAPEMNLSLEEYDALVDAGEINVWTDDDALALKTEIGRVRVRKPGNLTGRENSKSLRDAINAIMAYKCRTPARRKPVVGPGSGQSWRG